MNECKNPDSCYVVTVEDDPLFTIVIEMDLTRAGIKFCAASEGRQAFELIKSHLPKVLLLDISVPGMSGFEIIEALRADPALAELSSMHVVVHTSHDLSESERERLRFGRTIFLQKTQVKGDLSEIIGKLLAE